MKKCLAVALSSAALMVAPGVFAQSSGGSGDGTTGGEGVGSSSTTSPQAPLTPSQTETSQGSVSNPPPLDRSGSQRPAKVSGTGHGEGNTAGDSAPGTGGQDGTGTGGSGDTGGSGADGDGSGAGGAR